MVVLDSSCLIDLHKVRLLPCALHCRGSSASRIPYAMKNS